MAQNNKSVLAQNAVANRLLRALLPSDWDLVSAHLERVELRNRQVLHHARMPMEHVYFPEHALVSVSARSAPDQWAEVWLTGSEGTTGLPVFLGNPAQPSLRRVVQVGGPAYRIASQDLMKAVRGSQTLDSFFLRYTAVVLLQAAQAGACNGHHTVKQRLARWLAMSSSGLQNDVVPLTHNVLARLVGVRRPSITECLGVLQQEGAIRMSRASIQIVDFAALDAACCHCTNLIRNEYSRIVEGHRTSEASPLEADHG